MTGNIFRYICAGIVTLVGVGIVVLINKFGLGDYYKSFKMIISIFGAIIAAIGVIGLCFE